MKYIIISLVGILSLTLFTQSCDKVKQPYEVNNLELDTTIYPGIWADYIANEWPIFTANTNNLRNVLIEDFTGHKCIFCPAAGKLADDLEEANPNRVFAAGIHTSPNGIGSFQELHAPLYIHDFTNAQGLEIGTYFGSIPGSSFVGNPHGAVSRFPDNGQNTNSPGTWTNTVNNLISTNDLRVNLQAQLKYFPTTNGFYLHTEIEKFASVTNELAQVVYFIEDSIIKPQSFPGGKDSINYLHHNVQRNCIDGKAFGRTLKESDKQSNGKYYLNYSYKIPNQYNPKNVHLLVYVYDKTTMEIYHVIKVEVDK